MPSTLAEAIAEDRIEFEELERHYQPVLSLVDVLIGVVPNCDRYLEIWRPGFRTYNLIVPNFLNLPASLMGLGTPKDLVGLGMYASSRAAGCGYCSAHTCSFALRRGASANAVSGADRDPREAAVVAIAEALATVPHQYQPELRVRLESQVSAGDAEWIVMGIAMMGFLNKFMDAVGVELEQGSVDDVAGLIEPTGWSVGQHGWAGAEAAGEPTQFAPPASDSAGTIFRVLRSVPGAIRLDREWMAGVPKDPVAAQRLVAENYGFDEPLLTAMRHARPRRALAAVLRHNLDPEQTEIGIGRKALAGLVFATHAENPHLVERAEALAEHHGVAAHLVAAARSVEQGASMPAEIDDVTSATIELARSISPSPAAVDQTTVDSVRKALTSAQIVELVVWVSVNQLLHRSWLYLGNG